MFSYIVNSELAWIPWNTISKNTTISWEPCLWIMPSQRQSHNFYYLRVQDLTTTNVKSTHSYHLITQRAPATLSAEPSLCSTSNLDPPPFVLTSWGQSAHIALFLSKVFFCALYVLCTQFPWWLCTENIEVQISTS